MTQKTSPWIEGKYGWNFGESGWNTGMDENLLKFSFLFDRNIDGIVSTLPPEVNGRAYFLTTDNRVYYVVDGIYSSCNVPKWFLLVDRASGDEYVFNGSALIQVNSPSQVETELQNLQDQIDGLGSAAQEDVSYFTAQTDLASQVIPGSNLVGYLNSTLTTRLQKLRFPEEFSSLAAWASSGGNLGIVGGTYTVTEQLTFPHGTVVHTFGRATLDASAVASLTNFPDLAVVMAGGLTLTALPKLTAASIGDLTLNFASAHGLNAGDLFCIYNPVDSSYAPGHRVTHHAGEYCRVARVTSPTQVVLDSPLYATYVAASMDYYKMGAGSFHICGDLVVKGSITLNTMRAFRGFQLIDSDLTGLTAISPIGPSAIELRQCVNVTGNVTGMQLALSGLGVDYGLSLVGTQDIHMSGYFLGSRHGITTGSYGQAGDVVNRNIQIEGTAKTTSQGNVAALNLHGNTEYFSFDGLSYGGVELAGNFSKIRGTIFGSSTGYCVWFGELSGHDHDIAGCTLRTLSNPGNARGVVDLGGDTIPALAGTLGGTINMRGVTVIAPNSTRGIMCRQRVCTATDINIDVRDVNIQKLAVGAVALFVDKVSGADYNVLMRSGFADNTGSIQSVAGVTTIKGARASGKVSFTTGTGVSSLSLAVTYPVGLFGSTAPDVTCSVSSAIVGTKGIVFSAASQSATGFTATIATADGTNFSSVVAITFGWSAESTN